MTRPRLKKWTASTTWMPSNSRTISSIQDTPSKTSELTMKQPLHSKGGHKMIFGKTYSGIHKLSWTTQRSIWCNLKHCDKLAQATKRFSRLISKYSSATSMDSQYSRFASIKSLSTTTSTADSKTLSTLPRMERIKIKPRTSADSKQDCFKRSRCQQDHSRCWSKRLKRKMTKTWQKNKHCTFPKRQKDSNRFSEEVFIYRIRDSRKSLWILQHGLVTIPLAYS